jgi:hypothetical protein
VLAVVDAWRYEEYGIIGHVVWRMNRVVYLSEAALTAWEYATLPEPVLTPGSVKMGQPILHPRRRFSGSVRKWGNEWTQSEWLSFSYILPPWGTTVPTGWLLPVYTYTAGAPFNMVLGVPAKVSELRLSQTWWGG